MSANKCQWCGADNTRFVIGRFDVFKCGSTAQGQSDLCRERAKSARLQRRVEELEGLLIGNEDFRDGEIWIEVLIPQDRLGGERVDAPYISTLGEAMPRKEEL